MAELYYYYLYHLYLYHLYVYLHMYLCFMCLCMLYLYVVFVFAVQCSVVEDSCRISMIMGTDGLCAVLTPGWPGHCSYHRYYNQGLSQQCTLLAL